METALIAAAVAALVSVLTQLIQLWIARRSRLSAENAPARQLLSDEKRHQLTVIRRLQVEIERIRIHIWTIQAYSSSYTSPDKSAIESLERTVSALHLAVEKFGGNWAQIKFDVPTGVQRRMRRIWHDLRPPVGLLLVVERQLAKIKDTPADDEIVEERRAVKQALLEASPALKQVLDQIREFTELLAVSKAYLLGELGDA